MFDRTSMSLVQKLDHQSGSSEEIRTWALPKLYVEKFKYLYFKELYEQIRWSC